MTTVIVLGSNSFSGATFTAHALEQGADVIGISRSDEPHEVFLPYRWRDDLSRFRFIRGDLNHDLDMILKTVEEAGDAYLVNFAAQSMVGQSWDAPTDWMRTNAVATTELFNRLRHVSALKKYVHVTTPEVYGSTDGVIEEDAPFRPSTPYAVSRAAGDMSLQAYIDAYGLPGVMTRAANVYGPGQPLYRIIPRAIFYFMTGQKLRLDGGGVSERSFIHMDDVAAATWAIMTRGSVGEAYHISTERTVSIRQLVELICARMAADFENCVEIGPERLGKDAQYFLNSRKLRESLGWSDVISLEEGLESCVEWVGSRLDVLQRQPSEYVHKP